VLGAPQRRWTITVTNVNDAPVIGCAYAMAEDRCSQGAAPGVLANDRTQMGGAPINFVRIEATCAATFPMQTARAGATSTATNFTGIDTFTYKASDGAARAAWRRSPYDYKSNDARLAWMTLHDGGGQLL